MATKVAAEKKLRDAVDAKPEMKAKWGKLEPEVQTYLATQDKEVARNFTRYGQAVKAAEPLMQAANKYRDTFRGWKMSPDQAIDTVMQREIALDRDPLGTILHLAKEKGVDLSTYVASQIDPDLLPPDPRVQRFEMENAQLKRHIAQLENQRHADLEDMKAYFEHQRTEVEQQRYGQLNTVLATFTKDKPDFAKYETKVAALIGPIRSANPELSGEQALAEAYETARWQDSGHRQSLIEAERKKADAAQSARAAALASSINVQGHPQTNGSLSLRQVQDAAYERAMRRVQSPTR